jgi:tRNA (mo5U34)-methyltransferase
MDRTLETEMLNPQSPLEKEISSLGTWFHNLHLPDGTQTAPFHPLGDFPSFKWKQLASRIPEDLSGWKVLDIGCNAGFYSFELAKRGAEVLGIDMDEHYLKQAEWAAKLFKLKGSVEFKKMQVYDLASYPGSFNMILFMGVFYHLRYPLLALDLLAGKFDKLMIFQTMTMPEELKFRTPENIGIYERHLLLNTGWPKMAFIENKLAGDQTNWWVPNPSAIEAMIRSTGMEITEIPAHEIYFCTNTGTNYSWQNAVELKAAIKALKNTNRKDLND